MMMMRMKSQQRRRGELYVVWEGEGEKANVLIYSKKKEIQEEKEAAEKEEEEDEIMEDMDKAGKSIERLLKLDRTNKKRWDSVVKGSGLFPSQRSKLMAKTEEVLFLISYKNLNNFTIINVTFRNFLVLFVLVH
jgi:hypothetical protein